MARKKKVLREFDISSIPDCPEKYRKNGGGFFWLSGYQDFLFFTINRSNCSNPIWSVGWMSALEDVYSSINEDPQLSKSERSYIDSLLFDYQTNTMNILRPKSASTSWWRSP